MDASSISCPPYVIAQAVWLDSPLSLRLFEEMLLKCGIVPYEPTCLWDRGSGQHPKATSCFPPGRRSGRFMRNVEHRTQQGIDGRRIRMMAAL